MPNWFQARVGKLENVRLAAMAAAQQQFGRFRPFQIISRVDDVGIDLFARLGADERQLTASGLFSHDNDETTSSFSFTTIIKRHFE